MGGNGSPDGAMLTSGSRVGVIGSGPAGSFFSYFLQELAGRMDIDLAVDVYEPRDFNMLAPQGCNMCGGIISETLVQNLATEGVDLPPTIVQRGIDSYVLHTDVGSVHIATPLEEKRIGAVHRGPGPRDLKERKWGSFDGHLQSLALKRGARLIPERVSAFTRERGLPTVQTREKTSRSYDLLAVAVGVNSPTLKLFQEELDYTAPRTVKTFIREFYLGEDSVNATLGNSMHVFLLNIPRLEFAAVVPKGDYISMCLLGEDIDKQLVEAFLESPELKKVISDSIDPFKGSCQCSPRINVGGAVNPFADRIVFLGDSGVTRLYKDGIGAAYRTAKAAAGTAVLHGVSAKSFERHYWPVCRSINTDNKVGKATFAAVREVQKRRFARRALLRMTENEQRNHRSPRMSSVLWDLFTGSATYRNVILRALHPAFMGRFAWNLGVSLVKPGKNSH